MGTKNNFQLEGKALPISEVKFSLYGAGINSTSGQKPYMQGTLRDVCAWMSTPRMASITRQLRAIDDESGQKRFKTERLPFATFSGQFSYRKADGLIQHSGLQCFDFDHLSADDIANARQLLLSDPYFGTELIFTSPRGNGIKWVTHVDLSRATHEQWYSAVRAYLHSSYGLEADSAPSNVASACFLCFDAEMVVNPDVLPF